MYYYPTADNVIEMPAEDVSAIRSAQVGKSAARARGIFLPVAKQSRLPTWAIPVGIAAIAVFAYTMKK